VQLHDDVVPVLAVDLGPGVRAGFTTRAGGVSQGPWAGLDLGLAVGDEPEAVRRNRALLADWAGAPVHFGRQVHGTVVARVGVAGVTTAAGDQAPDAARVAPDGDAGQEPEADALVTTERGLPLGVLVADCVPVLLADAEAGVVATAHAGRRGLLDGVLPRVVEAMAAAGARPGAIRAAVGPAAGGCCYEVPAGMQAEACAGRPELRATTTWGTPSLDLRAGAVADLTAAGLADVTVVGGCTVESDDLYSYRRSRVTGRFAGVVALLP
jgi:polyphenol oxidase